MPKCSACGGHQTIYTYGDICIHHCKCGSDDVVFTGIRQALDDVDEDSFQFKVNCFDRSMAALVLYDLGETHVLFMKRSIVSIPYVEGEDYDIKAFDLFNYIILESRRTQRQVPTGVYIHPPLFYSNGVFFIKSTEVVKMPLDERKIRGMVYSSACRDGDVWAHGKYLLYVFIGQGSPFGRWFVRTNKALEIDGTGDSLFRKKVDNGSGVLRQTVKDIVREDMDGSFSAELDLEWDDM